jgi:hypothetical protein
MPIKKQQLLLSSYSSQNAEQADEALQQLLGLQLQPM